MRNLAGPTESHPFLVIETGGKHPRLTITKEETRLKVPKSLKEDVQTRLVTCGRSIDKIVRKERCLRTSFRGKFRVRPSRCIYIVMMTGRGKKGKPVCKELHSMAFIDGKLITKEKP